MLMEMGLISFSAVEMAVPIRSRASSIFLTNAFLWPAGRGHGLDWCCACPAAGGRRSWHQGARRQQGSPCRGMPEAKGTRRLHARALHPTAAMAPSRPRATRAGSLSFAAVPCQQRRVPGRLLQSVLPPMVEEGEGPRRRRRRPSPLRPVPLPLLLLDGGEGPRRPST